MFGDVDPGGRLPVTFPASTRDLPTGGSILQYPGAVVEEYYTEGVDVGYRWYDAHHLMPAFAFGSGLSYTTFRYDDLTVTPDDPRRDSVATVAVDVTNTGPRTGEAVPELYLSLSSPVPQPPRELKGYSKVSLRPGETARVTFPLNDRSFAYWDVKSNSWQVAPGCYDVAVGSSSRSLPLHGEIGRGHVGCGPETGERIDIVSGAAATSDVLPAAPSVAYRPS
jgi:beta-glucosidase